MICRALRLAFAAARRGLCAPAVVHLGLETVYAIAELGIGLYVAAVDEHRPGKQVEYECQ